MKTKDQYGALDRSRRSRKRNRRKKNWKWAVGAGGFILLALFIWFGYRAVTGESRKSEPESQPPSVTEQPVTERETETENTVPPETLGESTGGQTEESASIPAGEGPDMADTEVLTDDFSDAVFIGASQTANLKKMNEMAKATIYGQVGLNIDTVFTKKFIPLSDGTDGTVMDALAENKFQRVYILLGVNELGWPYMSVFEERYGKIISAVKELQPDAKIYVQSILPITKEKSEGDSIYNQANVEKFNKGIQEMCQEYGGIYVDVASALKNSQGYLPPGVSKDGVHLNHAYSIKWMNNLSKLSKQAGGQ